MNMWSFKGRSFLGGLNDQRETSPVVRRGCDMPGCEHLGDYRAPKSRYDLRDYYWFCLDHVREYNNNWDFFKGMTPGEIEQHMRKTIIGDRPTWRATQAGYNEERMKKDIYEHFMRGDTAFGDFDASGETDKEKAEAHINVGALPHPTIEALDVFGLKPPVTWDEVKARYKSLAKKYHPDTNKATGAEEELKKINLAYTILKLSYQTYSQLDER